MSSAWKKTACQGACYMENSYTARETRAVQKRGTKTVSKPTSSGVSSSPKNSRIGPATDHVGELQSTKQPTPLRMLDARNSLQPEISATGHREQLQLSSALTVPDSARPPWGCGVISELTDKNAYLLVIFVFEGLPPLS